MEKTYKSTQKYLLTSPRKMRLVVGMIKKMKPMDAIDKLPFASRRAAGDLIKVVKSALANARVQGASETDLIFKEIQIGEGPRLKRGRAASRGRWHPFKRRMSHIRVVLTTLNKDSKADKTAKADKQIPNKQINKLEKKKDIKTEKVSKTKGEAKTKSK